MTTQGLPSASDLSLEMDEKSILSVASLIGVFSIVFFNIVPYNFFP